MESNPSAEYTTLTGWLLSVVVTHHTNRSQNERIKLKKRKRSLPQLRFHLFFPKYKTETKPPATRGQKGTRSFLSDHHKTNQDRTNSHWTD